MKGYINISETEISDLRRSLKKALNFIERLKVEGAEVSPKLSKKQKIKMEVQRLIEKKTSGK